MSLKGGHGEQLKMFMRPGEIKGYVTDSVDRMGNESMGDLWSAKSTDIRREHQGRYGDYSLRGSVGDVGVKVPVVISHDKNSTWMGNGHHRVQAAAEKEAKTGKESYVPVVHAGYGEHMGDSPKMDRAFPAVSAAGFGEIHEEHLK